MTSWRPSIGPRCADSISRVQGHTDGRRCCHTTRSTCCWAQGCCGSAGSDFNGGSGFFAQRSWNDVSNGLVYGDAAQLGGQAIVAAAAPVYAFVATFVILRVIGLVTPLRASDREEALGMDIVQHGEEA